MPARADWRQRTRVEVMEMEVDVGREEDGDGVVGGRETW
jgi:hypothetical protein